ncbi:nuclear transport factor 2 family protein [Mycolicibacterium goodii]|uniref:SnoaL-like domain-containing protein n=1 Tax=Mycolicibacterium goodii TaxID=134601 RepID=A0A0K0X3S9_MYCGD|nr:hypothetical protein AFA91_09820 [Mycolicibacterium goodii]
MPIQNGNGQFARLKQLGNTVFGPFVQIAQAKPTRAATLEASLGRLEDELAIRDAFGRYHYFYDCGDADSVANLFTEDAVLVNPRGTYIGRAAVKRNYEFLMSRSGPVFHYATNVTVRVSESDPDQAHSTAFLWCVHSTGEDDRGRATTIGGAGGTYAIEWRRHDGEWLMAASRLTLNYRVGFTSPAGSTSALPPAPDLAESSTDWLRHDPDFAWPNG